MRLLYLADIRFPMERANGIQTIETCHALARRGVEVELAVRRSDARSDEACLAFYGLAPVKNLRLRRVLLPGRLGFLAYALTLLLRSDRRCCMIPTTPKESASYVFGAKTQNQWNQ